MPRLGDFNLLLSFKGIPNSVIFQKIYQSQFRVVFLSTGIGDVDAGLIDICLPDLTHFIGIDPRQDAIDEARKNIGKLNRKDDIQVI